VLSPRLLFLGVCPAFLLAQTIPVRIWEDTALIPTYREVAPEPIPPFDQLALNGVGNFFIYPYTMRQDLTKDKYAAPWRVLHLENQYLHCRILPDLGGHLYSCLDKLSGKEMFYANTAMKKTTSAPRGAWVAGGIETNFPIAHSRVSVSPVQFATATHPDGSATVYVGTVDRISGMEWTVGYTLHPGRAVLEQDVRLFNGSPARQPFQWWTNAAIPTPATGLRLTYPMWVTAPHGAGTLNSWPRSTSGVDLTDTNNYQETIGLFAYGSREPFFAAFNPESRVGVSHWADPKQVPGKKVWVWGSKQPEYKETFSDDHTGYTEIQAGLLTTQDMMEFLEPEQTRRFTEFWIPSRDTGGVTRATPDAVLYLTRQQKAGTPVLAFDLSVTHPISHATITISDGAQPIYTRTLDLDPRSTFHDVTGPVSSANHRFELLSEDGTSLLRHTENTYDAVLASEVKLLSPMPASPQKASGPEAAVLKTGEDEELIRMLDQAAVVYQTALKADPQSATLNRAAGRLSFTVERFADALNHLEASRLADPSNPETTYYLGLAKSRLGADVAAQALWRSLIDDPAFGPAARFQLAGAEARAGNHAAAIDLLHGLAAHGDSRSAAMEVALLRRTGQADAAKAALARILADRPADLLIRVEASFFGNDDPELWRLLAQDAEWILDVVDDYFHIGCFEDAVAVLSHPYPKVPELETDLGAVAPQDNPLISYYRAYARFRMGASPAEDLQQASAQSTLYVYPYRASTFPVLRAALELNPQDATAHYLLGCLLFNARLPDEALAEWAAAKPSGDRIPGYSELVARVSTLLHPVKRSPPSPPAPPAETAKSTPTSTAPPPRVSVPVKPAPAQFANAIEAADHALDELAAGNIRGGLAVFQVTNFPQEKQPPAVRQAFIETRLQALLEAARDGRCQLFPMAIDDLGSEDRGLPFTFASFDAFIKTPRVQFLLGVAEWQCGARKQAQKRWAKVAKATPPITSSDFAFPVLAATMLNPDDAGHIVQPVLEKLRVSGVEPTERLYSEALLLQATGRVQDAEQRFREGLSSQSAFWRYLYATTPIDTRGGR
jgi:hypothetical protein